MRKQDIQRCLNYLIDIQLHPKEKNTMNKLRAIETVFKLELDKNLNRIARIIESRTKSKEYGKIKLDNKK